VTDDVSRSRPSVLAPEASGGIVAQDGFQYQSALISSEVPRLLRYDGFTEMIEESLGDWEVKVYVPSRGLGIHFVEFKNHQVSPSEFWKEIARFRATYEAAPGTFLRYELVCAGVAPSLASIVNGLERLRKTIPFYGCASSVAAASREEFTERVLKHGESTETADFLLHSVDIQTQARDTAEYAFEHFQRNASEAFPCFAELVVPRDARGSHDAVAQLVAHRRGQVILRRELQDAFWHQGVEAHKPVEAIRLHTKHTDCADATEVGDLVLDWHRVFGGNSRDFPPPPVWQKMVVDELTALARWVNEHGRGRRIRLTGHRRLSTSVAVGRAFPSVGGFTIDVEARGGVWASDDYAVDGTPDPWDVELIEGEGEQNAGLVVGIGLMTDLRKDVHAFARCALSGMSVLTLTSQLPLQTGGDVNAAVNSAKARIRELAGRYPGACIHLFLACPAQFAIFLGHRLNAVGAVQCYEWQTTGVYVPTCLLEAGSSHG